MKMGGGARQFGVDAERVPALVKRIIAAGAEWRGFSYLRRKPGAFRRCDQGNAGADFGAGGGTGGSSRRAASACQSGRRFRYSLFSGDEPVDIKAVGEALQTEFEKLPAILADTEFCIELGRYLVGEAGVYLTRIVDRKISHGEVFLITDGGLHHQLAASGNFGTVIRRNYPVAIATRFGAEPEEVVSVVGCLCTPLDKLSDSAHLPHAKIGDLVAIFCAGAYGASASPANFLGQGPAIEMLV